jgi:hypothetical protein
MKHSLYKRDVLITKTGCLSQNHTMQTHTAHLCRHIQHTMQTHKAHYADTYSTL